MTSIRRKFLLGAGILALSATAAAAVPAVVRSDLNMRSGPGTEYAVVGSLPGGATVDVGSCTGRWCVVAYGSEQGYAARSYLDLGAAAVPVEPAYGPDYGYAEPDYYYGDDYYYGGYGPGVTFGLGYYGRGRHHGHHWRGHRDHDRDMANRPNGWRNRVGTAPASGGSAAIQSRSNNITVNRGPEFRSSPRRDGGGPGKQFGASASGNVTVGAGAPIARSAPSIRAGAGAGGHAGPSGGGAAATVGAGRSNRH
jgi:hypothetical protein